MLFLSFPIVSFAGSVIADGFLVFKPIITEGLGCLSAVDDVDDVFAVFLFCVDVEVKGACDDFPTIDDDVLAVGFAAAGVYAEVVEVFYEEVCVWDFPSLVFVFIDDEAYFDVSLGGVDEGVGDGW